MHSLASATTRVSSIDILRAVTMLLMVFVNDLWSLSNIPLWLEHTAAADDGMGLADIVFPSFLFVVGMSIPLAIANRRKKGDTTQQVLIHVLQRSLALLVMGVWLVNGESIQEQASGMPRVVWNMICWTCFIVLWNAWPNNGKQLWLNVLKIVAVLVLLLMAWLYRGHGFDGSMVRFNQQWWGILGLIGWAYLVSALVYSFSENKIWIAIVAWLFFNVLCMGSHAGWFHSMSALNTVLGPIGHGAMPAFVSGGILTTLLFQHFRNKGDNRNLNVVLSIFAAGLLFGGLFLRQYWGGISKIRATPSWIFICSGITVALFVLIYWVADVKGKAGWFRMIMPAGTNTLTCYMMPYFAYGIVVLLNLHLPAFFLTGGIGLVKSFVFALLMVVLTGVVGKRGVMLKL